MKKLGILGGTGPQSTAEYYLRIVYGFQKRHPENLFPEFVLNSVNNVEMLRLAAQPELDDMVDFMVERVAMLEQAGCDIGILAANTSHLVFHEVQEEVNIELISIVDTAADACIAKGIKRPVLFGTSFTMNAGFYPKTFSENGLDILIPEGSERQFVHDKYMSELVHGEVRPDTKAALSAIAKGLKEAHGADALILGGTELSLMFKESDADELGMPVIDTTQVHVDAAIDAMLGVRKKTRPKSRLE